jgi:hypothetical protein
MDEFDNISHHGSAVPLADHEHSIFGRPFICEDYRRLTGMPCPDTAYGAEAHAAVEKAKEEIQIVDEAALGKDSVEAEPSCFRCKRVASEIPGIVETAEVEEMTPQEYAREDGTYNSVTGHFACDKCYIEIGMPSGPFGWKAP